MLTNLRLWFLCFLLLKITDEMRFNDFGSWELLKISVVAGEA